jgi:uncharacterized protein YbaP (TraB family)
MVRGRRSFAAAALILTTFAVPHPAPAQNALSPAAPVDEVEVITRLPGPPLWRVSSPTSRLWILGLASPLPRGFQWDAVRVAAALDGARELVMPPAAEIGLGDLFGMLIDTGHVWHLPPGETVRSGLPPEAAARFEAAARSIGEDPARYDHWRPVLAALMLASDGERHYRLDPAGAQAAVADLARSRHVKLRRLASYKGGDLLKGLASTPPEAASACVALAARTVQRQPEDGPSLAAAWAEGDLKTLKALQSVSGGSACLDAAPAAAALRDRVAADWAKDLSQSLAAPGKTVAAVDLDSLTRKGGLLDQLRDQGLEVIGPAY